MFLLLLCTGITVGICAVTGFVTNRLLETHQNAQSAAFKAFRYCFACSVSWRSSMDQQKYATKLCAKKLENTQSRFRNTQLGYCRRFCSHPTLCVLPVMQWVGGKLLRQRMQTALASAWPVFFRNSLPFVAVRLFNWSVAGNRCIKVSAIKCVSLVQGWVVIAELDWYCVGPSRVRFCPDAETTVTHTARPGNDPHTI